VSRCAKRTDKNMKTDKAALVAALKKKREKEGLSIRGLAERIGVSFSSLARIERGEGEPDNNSSIRIMEWLGDDARDAGLIFENVALVHFRAGKNVRAKTIHCLLNAASSIKASHRSNASELLSSPQFDAELSQSIALSKTEMEEMAQQLRKDLGVQPGERIESLDINIAGVDVFSVSDVVGLSRECAEFLLGEGAHEWSAMSVPMDLSEDTWAILRNDKHTMERQRVTYLEECWHILLGHRLTRIAKIADAYGRTYDSSEEHDAFYLAAATLLPEAAVRTAVDASESAAQIAERFGASVELVEYRIKRLGLWRTYKDKTVSLNS
jgi:transcriptional regulator with XRE-family HTH domain